MAVNQLDTPVQGKHNPGFDFEGFGQLTLLLFLMLTYPLLGMLWHHQYPVFSIEIILLLFVFLLLAGLLSLLLHHYCRSLLVNLVLVTALTLAFLLHFNLFFIGLAVTMISSLVLSMILREKYPAFLLVVMTALITGSYIDNLIDRNRNGAELEIAQTKSGKGPLIHILMDGFIGPDGLPQTDESQHLRSEIMAFFEEHEFQVHTRAYTHYSNTTDSMTRALNFRNDDKNIFQRMALLRVPISFRENAWFRALSDFGYPIVVYQTESLNFCDTTPPVVSHCNVFTIPNLNTIHSDVNNVGKRSVLLLRALYGQSTLITKILVENKMAISWGVSTYEKRMLTRLIQDVQLGPDNAYFAHVMLPHAPRVYRQDCSLDYESESWVRFPVGLGWVGNSDESRSKRYEKYVLQTKCALLELGTLFKALKEKGLYKRATIVIHGDHGSATYIYRPSARILNRRLSRDLKEIFSTLFAVKYPGGSFGVNNQTTSLNVLMAQTISEITGKTYEELSINVVSEDEPFIYLTDIAPLKRFNVDIFDPDNPEMFEPDNPETNSAQ
jgi:hypothetical protein